MKTINYIIRLGTPEDANILTDIAFRSKASWGYPKEWLNKWSAELTITPKMIEDWITFVAEYNGKVIGFWCRQAIQTDEISSGFLFIDPDYFGNGIAKKLWNSIKDALISKGVRQFTIEADPNAVAFYEKIGGVKIGDKDSQVIKGRKIPIMRFELSKS